MTQTVVQHVLERLKGLGIRDVFGVPGDFSFAVSDAICADPEMRWIGACNELNAAYAADGYARVKGFSALATTFGVGELSALAGIAGSYAEHLPVVHLVGMPHMRTQHERRIVHHTLGTGEFDLYVKMARPVVSAAGILTPENAVAEMNRLVQAAIRHHRPVYIAIPADYADMPVHGGQIAPPADESSNHAALCAAAEAILEKLSKARSAVILAGYQLARLGLEAEATALVEASGLPFATMFMDKTSLDETHPQYIGMYDGRIMEPQTREFVEGCDCVLNLGALWSDFNTGAFTANIDAVKMIAVMHHHVRIGHAVYEKCEMADVLRMLAGVGWKCVAGPLSHGLGEPVGGMNEPITPEYFYPRWEKFFRPGDLVVAETGTVAMGLGFAKMPKGALFFNQTLWGSIGWATPAAFGVAMAAPKRRTVLVTGEGAHQFTLQEIAQFDRFGLKPVICCLSNDGYLIERLLCKDPMAPYNDLAPMNYHLLPQALGCEGWYSTKVTTNGELDAALAKAEKCGTGCYIEAVMDKMASPPLARKIHESLATLYGQKE